MTDLTSLSPAEIDTLWAPLHYATVEAYWAEVDARSAARQAQRKLDDPSLRKLDWRGQVVGPDQDDHLQRIIDRANAMLPALHETWRKADEAEIPFRHEWDRRDGWNRAYLVITNGTGHVHTSTRCSTCYPTTRFEWMTEQSGMSQDEIVELAGERACTVCYPSAPVETRNRPTKLFGAAEIAARKVREEKAAKKAAADAEKITVEGICDVGDRPGTKVFKSVRAATNFIATELSSLTWYGMTHPSANRWVANVESIRAALAAKGVEFDYDKALANARKRTTREGGVTKF